MNIRTVTYEGFTFVDVHNPQEFEIKFLRHNYDFDQLHLDDYLQRQQITKMEIEKDYILFSLDFPYLEHPHHHKKHDEKKEKNGHEEKDKKESHHIIPTPPLPTFSSTRRSKRMRTGHVAIFLKDSYLVVLHDDKTPQIDEIFEECQKTLKNREEYMGLGAQYLFYRIVDTLVDASIATINEITATIDIIDQHLLENSAAEGIVEDISATRRNIVVFQTMVKPAMTIFSDLENNRYPEMNPSLAASWGNVKDHLQRIWYRLEDSKELIEGISTSHESLLTARTNEIVKVLTMFTAILLPLTLLASIYGMNIVKLPYADQANALVLILLVMGIMAVGMMLLFKLKKWL